MIKKLSILSIAAAAVGLAATAAHAESVVLRAEVPFAFVVGDRTLPSGEYRFVQSDNRALVQVYSKRGDHLATVLCQGVPLAATESERLVFHRYGSQRFLKLIRGGDGSGVYFPITPVESEALRQAQASGAATPAGMP